MKRVALIINHLSGGGAERAVSKISLALGGHYDLFLILSDGSKIDYEFEGRLVDLGIPHADNILLKMINAVKRIIKLRKVKKMHDIDISISFHELSNVANIFSRQRDRIILSVRNVLSERNKKVIYDRLYGIIVKFFYNRADRIVAVSELCKRDLVKNFKLEGDRITVIYNLYNFDSIRQLSDEKDKMTLPLLEQKYISTMGRLADAKGHWHLIRAFSEVHRSFPDVKLYILGDGELRDYLKSLAADLALENHVLFMGYQKNPFKYLANSKLFVLPSLFEGFPNALAEAMACGVPVISFDCPSGPREILAPDTDIASQTKAIEYAQSGILVPAGDGTKYMADDPLTREERILSEAIIKLLTDGKTSKAYGHKAQKRIMDFEVKKIVRRWIEVIESA